MTENLERIAELTDELENLVHAMNIPMPASFHLEQLKKQLPIKINLIRSYITDETGENPWE